MTDLEARVERIFKEVLVAYGFFLQAGDDGDDVFLLKTSFALHLFEGRDGVSLSYIRKTASEIREYPLGHFLATKRVWVPAGPATPVADRELEAYSLTLQESGKDILGGDDRWLLGFPMPSYPVAPDFRRSLWEPGQRSSGLHGVGSSWSRDQSQG